MRLWGGGWDGKTDAGERKRWNPKGGISRAGDPGPSWEKRQSNKAALGKEGGGEERPGIVKNKERLSETEVKKETSGKGRRDPWARLRGGRTILARWSKLRWGKANLTLHNIRLERRKKGDTLGGKKGPEGRNDTWTGLFQI